jgi:hypothetical protein
LFWKGDRGKENLLGFTGGEAGAESVYLRPRNMQWSRGGSCLSLNMDMVVDLRLKVRKLEGSGKLVVTRGEEKDHDLLWFIKTD